MILDPWLSCFHVSIIDGHHCVRFMWCWAQTQNPPSCLASPLPDEHIRGLQKLFLIIFIMMLQEQGKRAFSFFGMFVYVYLYMAELLWMKWEESRRIWEHRFEGSGIRRLVVMWLMIHSTCLGVRFFSDRMKRWDGWMVRAFQGLAFQVPGSTLQEFFSLEGSRAGNQKKMAAHSQYCESERELLFQKHQERHLSKRSSHPTSPAGVS